MLVELESYVIPILTFLLGLLSGLLYKYSDIVKLKTDVETLKTNQVGISAMAGDVRVMKESLLFQPAFIQKLALICSEHTQMHDQIDVNTNRLTSIEAKLNK
jgi:hypothetical protein